MTQPNGLHVDHQPREWQCTKPEASWCPLCGDCTCDRVDVGKMMRSPNCPLHGEMVAHPDRVELVMSRSDPKPVLL